MNHGWGLKIYSSYYNTIAAGKKSEYLAYKSTPCQHLLSKNGVHSLNLQNWLYWTDMTWHGDIIISSIIFNFTFRVMLPGCHTVMADSDSWRHLSFCYYPQQHASFTMINVTAICSASSAAVQCLWVGNTRHEYSEDTLHQVMLE